MVSDLRLAIAGLAALALAQGIGRFAFTPLLPMMQDDAGLSLAQVGLIRSAHRTAMAAFQIPAGLFAERFGERNLLAAGTAVTGAALR